MYFSLSDRDATSAAWNLMDLKAKGEVFAVVFTQLCPLFVITAL